MTAFKFVTLVVAFLCCGASLIVNLALLSEHYRRKKAKEASEKLAQDLREMVDAARERLRKDMREVEGCYEPKEPELIQGELFDKI